MADGVPQVLTRFEGMELMGLSPLIYAIDAVDVTNLKQTLTDAVEDVRLGGQAGG